MRPIKFRAWHNGTMVPATIGDDGHVTIWDALDEHYLCIGVSFDEASSLIKRCDRVMQYTGLKDRNGVEIYEGDILQTRNGSKYTIGFSVAEMSARISLSSKTGSKTDIGTETAEALQVIGNIYENPELLEGAA